MTSPNKRPLAYVANYQCADDNMLTATYLEQVRIRNEEKLRNVQSVLKLNELTINSGMETSPHHHVKQMQLGRENPLNTLSW